MVELYLSVEGWDCMLHSPLELRINQETIWTPKLNTANMLDNMIRLQPNA